MTKFYIFVRCELIVWINLLNPSSSPAYNQNLIHGSLLFAWVYFTVWVN